MRDGVCKMIECNPIVPLEMRHYWWLVVVHRTCIMIYVEMIDVVSVARYCKRLTGLFFALHLQYIISVMPLVIRNDVLNRVEWEYFSHSQSTYHMT